MIAIAQHLVVLRVTIITIAPAAAQQDRAHRRLVRPQKWTLIVNSDEEALTGLLTGAEEAVVVGEIATIAGAEIRIMAVDCPADVRRGLTAVCERDGRRYELSLADIRFGDASSLRRIA